MSLFHVAVGQAKRATGTASTPWGEAQKSWSVRPDTGRPPFFRPSTIEISTLMARSRLPAKKALTSGAALKNAGRYRGRTAPKEARPVGAPYPGMTAVEQHYWAEFIAGLPWLNARHRVLLRVACQLSSKIDRGELGVTAARALSTILSKLGATPIDEARVTQAGEHEEDPAEEFFGAGGRN